MKLGLTNDSGVRGRNVGIVEGTFRLAVPEGTAGAVSRTNKVGRQVTEMVFSTLTGFITDISFEETEYGKKVNISINADQEYKLSLGYADSLTSTLFKMLPNVDTKEPVGLVLQRKPDDTGKEKTSLFLNQNGGALKWHYTKSEPRGMPPMKQITVKGNKVWDNTKQIEFLIENSVNPFIQKLQVTLATVKGSNMDGSISDEDIPF